MSVPSKDMRFVRTISDLSTLMHVQEALSYHNLIDEQDYVFVPDVANAHVIYNLYMKEDYVRHGVD